MQKNKLFLTFAIVAFVMMLLLVLPFVLQDKMADVGNTDDMSPVQLTLGEHGFSIPKAYMWYKPNWEGITNNAIHMVVTLPDFVPYSKRTQIFYKGGPGLKYKVSFDLFKAKEKELRNETYHSPSFLETCDKKWQEFKVCPYKESQELYEVMVNPESTFKTAFICPKLASQRSPFCHTELSFSDGLTLKIGMHEKQLQEADQIIARILQTTCMFRTDSTQSICS